MAFWTSADSTPKRKFRFQVSIDGFGTNSVVWWAKTVKKPSFTIGAAEHKYLNHTFYFPGNVTWDECTMTLVDPAGGSGGVDAMKELLDIIKGTGYAVPTDASDLDSITKGQAVSATGEILIKQVDGAGNVQEEWKLHNAWVSKVDGGDLSYGEDALSEISLTIKYDWASCTAASGTAKFFDTDGS